jgi:hypothetical protein
MINSANDPRKFRYLLWREVFRTATMLDGLMVTTIQDVTDTRYKHWGNPNPTFHRHLRTWGEAGTVKLKDKRAVKIDDRGYTCMFVGYPDLHASDNYRMWDPRSKRVHITRDVIWLNKMFFEQPPTLPTAEIYSINNSLETFLETTSTTTLILMSLLMTL